MANNNSRSSPPRRYLPLAIISLALFVLGVTIFYRLIAFGHVLYHPHPHAPGGVTSPTQINPSPVTNPPVPSPVNSPVPPSIANELNTAAMTGDLATVKRIIAQHPALVNAPDTSENAATPLLRAIKNNHQDVVDFLLAHGADVNVHGQLMGRNALHLAAFQGDAELVQTLLRHGAEVDARESDGGTALFIAAGKGHLEVAKILLRYHADVNVTEKTDNLTPLHAAASGDHAEIAQLLLAHGASAMRKSRVDGFTPLAMAQAYQAMDVVAVLKKAGVRK